MSLTALVSATERFRGCLLGGAIGDALGAPVEFMTRKDIVGRFGSGGIRDFVPAYGVTGAITDDTQMSLFTAEGLLRAHVRGCLRGISIFAGVTGHAYLRWLETQGLRSPLEISRDGWLWGIRALHHRRAPGNTCVSALGAKRHFGEPARNNSKGCGGVMRVAPVGLYMWRAPDRTEIARRTFDLAVELAGHRPAG
jgi:ADP-ribosylglycohydrolase